jgi:hypothetical protein
MKRLFTAAIIALVMISLFAAPAAASKKAAWNVPGDFPTIQQAIDSPSVAAGDIIQVSSGSYAGALVSKSVTIKGAGHTVINSGPAHPSGMIIGFRLLPGSDNSKISNLRFEVDLGIISSQAVNDVTIEDCTFKGAVQAVTNWSGNRWNIDDNDIIDLKTRDGGGIGILVGDRTGGTVQGNVISNNKISGTLYVGGGYLDPSQEGGGYNGSGIVLYADFRYGAAGTSEIKNNRITNNKVSMVSNNAALVDIVAFEMTDSRDDAQFHVIFNNMVMFNDFRGTATQIDLTPDNLGAYNTISRNFGENRGRPHHDKHERHGGHGLH